jgi:hypothetical protein
MCEEEGRKVIKTRDIIHFANHALVFVLVDIYWM